jgi:hypothetical protein
MDKKSMIDTYNFYKDCTDGTVTKDGYAIVSFGKQYMIIYQGQQLELCKTNKSAQEFIKKHRTQVKKGTVFVS